MGGTSRAISRGSGGAGSGRGSAGRGATTRSRAVRRGTSGSNIGSGKRDVGSSNASGGRVSSKGVAIAPTKGKGGKATTPKTTSTSEGRGSKAMSNRLNSDMGSLNSNMNGTISSVKGTIKGTMMKEWRVFCRDVTWGYFEYCCRYVREG